MIKILFGTKIIESSVDHKDKWMELSGSHSNEFLISILEAQFSERMNDLRSNVNDGELGKAQKENGYMECLENLVSFLSDNIREGISEEQ